MNEQFDGTEQRLRAADPASTTNETLSESVLEGLGQRKPTLKAPRRIRKSAVAGGGAGVAALALTLTLTLAGVGQQPLITLGDASATNLAGGRESLSGMPAADQGMIGQEMTDKMMVWQSFNYLAGQDLTADGSRGLIYQVNKSGDPIEILNSLAQKFGVSGSAKEDEYSTAEFPSYSIQGDDFYLSVYWSGTGSWSFGKWSNQPWVECVYPESEERSSDSTSSEPSASGSTEPTEPLPVCVEPTPTPELIPSKSALQLEAFELFASTGYNGSLSDVDVYRDDWGAWAVASYLVGSEKVAIEWNAGWGQDGKLTWAAGHSVEIVQVAGDFGVISQQAAVERLNAGGWWGGLPNEYYQTQLGTGAVTYPSDSEGGVVDVTVESAELVLLTVYDAKGNAWLVPGYAMNSSLGWVESVIAVEDGVIELPKYADVMPMEGVPMDGVKVSD